MFHAYDPSSAAAFNVLPIELNKAIVHELDSDKDIATFRLICRATNDAIDADRLSFWRTKFRERFDFKDGKPNLQLRRSYQRRSKMLRRGTRYSFFRGHDQKEIRVLEVLRDLIVEAFQGGSEADEHGRPTCKNHARLLDFVLNSQLLLNDRRAPDIFPDDGRPTVSNMLAVVKLMCSQLIFGGTEGLKHDIFAFDEAQHAVYQSALIAPLFPGTALTVVNMEWMLHAMNFFRHHMMNEDAQTLFNKIEELDVAQKPSAWREPLTQGAYPLSKYWRGTYSFLESLEVQRLRKQGPGVEVYIDKNVDEGKIQSLELDFAQNGRMKNGKKLKWPPAFEDRLHSKRSATVKEDIKTQGRNTNKTDDGSIQFMGHGEDLDDEYMALGWLNPLPPQANIPGWQRITFMKHFNENLDDPMEDNLWAYEGVVLPGGRVILGRWWFASETNSDYNGPFILWAVDEPEIVDDSTDAE